MNKPPKPTLTSLPSPTSHGGLGFSDAARSGQKAAALAAAREVLQGQGRSAAGAAAAARQGTPSGTVASMRLATVTSGLVLAAMVVAAALAWGLVVMLDAGLAQGGRALWVAPVAAVVGVLAACVPLVLAAMRLRREPEVVAPLPVPLVMGPEGVSLDLFNDLASREWARARRYGTGTAILLVQIDRFARLVEGRGPDAAEAALTELLRQTAPGLRGADLLTRFSECEMAVFLAQADATGALDVAERIRERAEQLQVDLPSAPGQKLRLTVSVGVAHLRPAHLNLQALTEDAEDAVIAARQAGGNCVRAAPVDRSLLRAPGGPWRDGSRTPP